MASHVGVLNATESLIMYGTKYGRADGATVACNVGVPTESWHKRGGWSSDVKWLHVQHKK